jgi:nitrous oxidase accessory protein NosD
MRHLLSVSLICLLGALTVVSANAKTLHVPDQYPTIAAAVAAAKPGDSIHVEEGIYGEKPSSETVDPHLNVAVQVDTSNLEIVGEEGAILDGAATTAVAPGMFTTGFNINATGVTIRGFTVRGFSFGIQSSWSGCRFQANTVTGCGVGIIVATNDGTLGGGPTPAKSTVDHNSMLGNGTGIDINGGENVTVTHNIVVGNGVDPTEAIFSGPGISVEVGSLTCNITQNLVSGSANDGISLDFVQNIIVSHNTSSGNGTSGVGNGIILNDAATQCVIDHNETDANAQDGILVFANYDYGILWSFNNVLTQNTALYNLAIDLEDVNGELPAGQALGTNSWTKNKFGTHRGF